MRGGQARCTLGAKAVDNGGLCYGAMESALRPPLPTATQALAELQIQPWLDQRLRAKHHRRDPRKQTPSGRHQIGIPAGFKSESVAGFLLECVAGFVGIRKRADQKKTDKENAGLLFHISARLGNESAPPNRRTPT